MSTTTGGRGHAQQLVVPFSDPGVSAGDRDVVAAHGRGFLTDHPHEPLIGGASQQPHRLGVAQLGSTQRQTCERTIRGLLHTPSLPGAVRFDDPCNYVPLSAMSAA